MSINSSTTSSAPFDLSIRGTFAGLDSSFAVTCLLFAYVILTPNLSPLPELSIYDSKRVAQLALLVVNAILLLFSLQESRGPTAVYASIPARAKWTLGIIIALGCLSSVTAAVYPYALLEVFHLALLGLVTLSIAHFAGRSKAGSARLLVSAIAVSAVLYLLTFAVNFAMSAAFPNIAIWPTGYIGFENIRFFNQYQSWTLPFLVLLPLMVARRRLWLRLLLLTPASLWWMLTYASAGRGIFVASVVSTVVVFLMLRRHSYAWARLQLGAALAGAVWYGIVFKLIVYTEASLLARMVNGSRGRLANWAKAVDYIQSDWLLGIGPIHYAASATEAWSHPHNALLQFAAEWGVPAAGLLSILLLWGFVAWIRQTREMLNSNENSSDGHLRVALTASLVAGAAHAMVSGVAVMPMSQTLMVLVIGWVLGLYISYGKSSPIKPARLTGPHRIVVGLLIVTSIVVVTWIAAPDALRRDESEGDYVEQVSPKHYHPRFWRQGAIRY